MKNLIDYINEQLIMELSADTYHNAAEIAKNRGDYDRMSKFKEAELKEIIKKIKAEQSKKQEPIAGSTKLKVDWYKKYKREIIKLIHSDKVFAEKYGTIIFKSGLIIEGDNDEEESMEFAPSFSYADDDDKIFIKINYIDFSDDDHEDDAFIEWNWVPITKCYYNESEKNKKNIIKFSKKNKIPQDVVNQALDFCKEFGF